MLMTGRHGGHSFIRGNYEMGGFADSLEGGQMPLPEGTFTLPEMLKQAHNYYPTHLWENGHWDTLHNPVITVHKKVDSATATDKDFDYFKGKDYAPAKMTEKALAFIDRNKQKRFFLYLPYTIPHVSLQAPDDYVKKYIGLFEERPYYGQQGCAASKYPLSTYAAMITFLDDQVGIIMEKIKELGLDGNTIIMFSSDNGATFNGGVDRFFFNSNGGLRGAKMDVYEGGIREPFIARWPRKIPNGTICNLPSVQFDLMATLADLTGQQPGNTDGISFLPELLGKATQQKRQEFLLFEYPEKGGQLAIRMGDWKGVRVNVRNNPHSPWQLFDLKTDEHETIDLAERRPDIIEQFNAIVKKEHREATVQEWEFVDPKFRVKKVGE